MKTERITERPEIAAALIKKGGLVAVPTETVYGLAADGLDAEAVEKIYELKGRPSVKPLSLMIPLAEAMWEYAAEVPEDAKRLAGRFWPGPLTIVLRAKELVPDIVRAGGETVAFRCPDHPLTLALLAACGVPLAAPSANPSGAKSPVSADEVLSYFDGQIDAVIDGGVCAVGKESTLIDMSRRPYRILRRGALGEDEIADALLDSVTVIGITGGSGSGKTSALRVLEELGGAVIDADRVYHELLKTDQKLLAEIEKRFPGTVRLEGLDRKALAEVVFNSREALEDLNRITHGPVVGEIRNRLRRIAMSGCKLAAIDAIALFGSGLDGLCAETVAVLAPKEQRIGRIMRRDGISRSQAEMRIDAQNPDDYFVSHCSRVLRNDADEASFRQGCREYFLEVSEHG
ncbi:MAG: threonylcarbamoyl-AMP synthase [Oscillospiraceae bacterium]|nr:threonylcarbamoyl-AMP synthase [Oscillospiraceae bacterium]